MPGANGRLSRALYTASDGRAEPTRAAPAMARAAQRMGVHILTNCAVRGLDFHAGQVASVVTERGVIAARAVVGAGGVWSELFCARHGLDLQVETESGHAHRAGGGVRRCPLDARFRPPPAGWWIHHRQWRYSQARLPAQLPPHGQVLEKLQKRA